MPLRKTTRSIKRQAMQAIHHPPNANDRVTVSKEMQSEKAKMVRELIPFLTYLYKKYMNAQISEDMAVLQFEDISIPISVGDTILGGKFKNKRIVVKSIGKNEKGDITINGKPLLKYRLLDESTINEFGGVRFDLIGYDKDGNVVLKKISRSSDSFMTDVAKDKGNGMFMASKGVEYVEIYYGKHHLMTLKDGGRKQIKEKGWSKLPISESVSEANAVSGGKIHKFITGNNLTLQGKKHSQIEFEVLGTDNKSQLVKLRILFPKNLAGHELNVPFKTIRRGPFIKTDTKGQFEGTINEIPMGDLQKIDQFADKKLNPVDVVLTDKHFFDRLNDPRNGKEISQAELIGFFKRLSKHKKEFVEFLNQYNSLVAVDDRTNINIPFMKQANKAIAKTVMRKKDFKTPDKKLEI